LEIFKALKMGLTVDLNKLPMWMVRILFQMEAQYNELMQKEMK